MRDYKIQFSQFNPTKIVYQFDSILSHTKIWFSALWTIFKIGLGANFQPRFLTGRHCETIPIGRAHLYCHGTWFARFNFLLGQKVHFSFHAREDFSFCLWKRSLEAWYGPLDMFNFQIRNIWVTKNIDSLFTNHFSAFWIFLFPDRPGQPVASELPCTMHFNLFWQLHAHKDGFYRKKSRS